MSKLSKRIENILVSLLINTGDMALKRRARLIIKELDLQDGNKILDVGCGDGYYLFLLSNLGLKLRLTGVDFDPNALRSAGRNLKGKRIQLVQADLMKKLPFPDDSFDKVVMSEVAEHLPDDIKGLTEVYRVLKPNGILCLTVPNANYSFLWDPVNWVSERFLGTHIKSGFWAGIWNQHIRLYTPETIRRCIERVKFKIGKVEVYTFWCLPFNHYLINIIARLLWDGKLSSQLSSSLSKYKTRIKKPLFIELPFKVVNVVDKLNDILQPKNQGVGIFIKAVKV